MITMKSGDIFRSRMTTITIPVNTKGVMGKGLALTAKQRIPELEPIYKKACISGELTIATPIIVPKYFFPLCRYNICLFATKEDWRDPSELDWIDQGLFHLYKIKPMSIAFAMLGCGLGGLNEEDVMSLFRNFDEALEGTCPIEIYHSR